MKTLSLLALLVALYYYHGSSTSTAEAATSAQAAEHGRDANQAIIAPAPSYQDRWKTGTNACTNLKTGPDAQVHWDPFLPDSQANWNQNQPSGYTSVSGIAIGRR